MRKKFEIFGLSLVALIAVMLIAPGCKKKEEIAPKNKSGADTVSVKVVTAARGDINIVKVYSGTIEGEEQANIVPKIPERITSLRVKAGEAVSAGKLIATLDKAGASSQYYQAEAAFQNAARDLERMKALIKEGAVSQQMVDGVQTNYNIQKANFDAAKSVVELTAPISGVVIAVNGRIGDLASPAMPLATIAQINRLKAIYYVGESDMTTMNMGQKVTIATDAKPGLTLTGTVNQISKSADVQSRSFEVKALFPNTGDHWFKPGMFCKVQTNIDTRKQVVVLPINAVVLINNVPSVYIVENGKAVLRTVQQGLNDGNNVEIVSGINAGDVVITIGATEVVNGSPVRVQQ